jgi:hypothetical protein
MATWQVYWPITLMFSVKLSAVFGSYFSSCPQLERPRHLPWSVGVLLPLVAKLCLGNSKVVGTLLVPRLRHTESAGYYRGPTFREHGPWTRFSPSLDRPLPPIGGPKRQKHAFFSRILTPSAISRVWREGV